MQNLEQLQAIEYAPARLCNLGVYEALTVHDIEHAVKNSEITFEEGTELISYFDGVSTEAAAGTLHQAIHTPDTIADLIPMSNEGANVFYSVCEAIFQSGM